MTGSVVPRPSSQPDLGTGRGSRLKHTRHCPQYSTAAGPGALQVRGININVVLVRGGRHLKYVVFFNMNFKYTFLCPTVRLFVRQESVSGGQSGFLNI